MKSEQNYLIDVPSVATKGEEVYYFMSKLLHKYGDKAQKDQTVWTSVKVCEYWH